MLTFPVSWIVFQKFLFNLSTFFNPVVYQLPSWRSPTPSMITPPLELANEEYDSYNDIGSPPSAFFTSRQLSSLYLSKLDRSNNSDIRESQLLSIADCYLSHSLPPLIVVWVSWGILHSSFLSMIISLVLYSSINPFFRNIVTAELSMAISSYSSFMPFCLATLHSKYHPIPP